MDNPCPICESSMRDIDILIPSWKCPDLLKVCIPHLKSSISVDCKIMVVLNEADQESIEYLDSEGIFHIDEKDNLGPSAVDLAIPHIDSKYVLNANTDMIFHSGWDKDLINIIENNYPCTASCGLVEPHGPWICDNLGSFTDPETAVRFHEKMDAGHYSLPRRICENHPILCRTDDFLVMDGYSDELDPEWIDLKGRGLDVYFAWKLWRMDNDYKFISSGESFVYHGSSLNSKGVPKIGSPGSAFSGRSGMTQKEFYTIINYWSEV